jgi:hypothetical protein
LIGLALELPESIMASKTGFDFDDFGGNVDVVIVKGDKASLANSDYLKIFA